MHDDEDIQKEVRYAICLLARIICFENPVSVQLVQKFRLNYSILSFLVHCSVVSANFAVAITSAFIVIFVYRRCDSVTSMLHKIN